jgi:hypothetical protein
MGWRWRCAHCTGDGADADKLGGALAAAHYDALDTGRRLEISEK